MPPLRVISATPRAVLSYLTSRGIAAPAPRESYTFDDVVDLWADAEAATRDRAIGLRVAELVPFGSFGAPEYLMVTSATLAASLRRLIRFYPLVNQGHELRLETGVRDARLSVHRHDGTAALPCYGDFVLVSIRKRIELALGVTFSHRLDRGRALVFDRELLDGPLPHADEELCEAIASTAGGRLDAPRDSTASVVRACIEDGAVELRAVSRRLAIGARTLQRRLFEEGTTFAEVVDDARRSRALRLLGRGAPIKMTAEALGFAEVRSFYRAFRRWTNGTPGEWRARTR